MSTVAVAPQDVNRNGLTPTYGAANAGGNTVPNNGQVLLHVKNGSGASINVTIATSVAMDGLELPDRVVAVPANSEKIIGPFPPKTYNTASGELLVTFSSVTTVTIAALRY